MGRKVKVVSYDPKWIELFQQEKECIERSLPQDLIVTVFHIGSTAVPELAAKPIIDLLLVVTDIEQLDHHEAEMLQLGYECLGEYGLPGRRFYQKGGDERTHQIHAYQFDNLDEIGRHLAVRDYLVSHPEALEAYAQIKTLAATHHPTNIEGYMDEKNDFVKKLEKSALRWLWSNK